MTKNYFKTTIKFSMKDDQRNSKFKMTNKKIKMEGNPKNQNGKRPKKSKWKTKKIIMEDKRNSKCNNNKD